MAELSFDLLLVLAAAFAAGLIDAMVGGGGLIQIPALFAVYPNVAPATLLGTSKFSGLLGMVSAIARYAQKVVIPWRELVPMALVALVMSVGGAWLARVVAPEIFRPLVPVMLLAVLIYVMWRKDLGGEHAPRAFSGSHHIVGAALIAAQGAGIAPPFGEGLNLQEIEPVAAWVEPYTALYQDYRVRLDAAMAQKSVTATQN